MWPTLTAHSLFKLNCTVRLFECAYPIVAIWQLAHAEHPPQQVDIAAGGVMLMVWRDALHVQLGPLDVAEYHWLRALQCQATLEQACAHALACNPQADINNYLKKHLFKETILLLPTLSIKE